MASLRRSLPQVKVTLVARRKSNRQSGGSRWVDPGNPTGTKPPPYNPFVPRPPRITEKDVVIEVIDGKPTVVAVGGKPTYGPDGPTQSNWLAQNRPELVKGGGGGGDTSDKKPTFNFNNVPEDDQYRLDREARRGALQTSLAGYEAGENSAAYDYGIGFDRYASDVTDAQGRLIARAGDVNFSTLRMPGQSQYDADRGFDTANPFSRASRLNEAFTSNRKISMGGYANRGLLTSGAYGRAQYRDADRYNRGASDLQKEFASRLGEYRAQRGQAYSNYDTSNIDDRRQLVERALRQFQLNNPSA